VGSQHEPSEVRTIFTFFSLIFLNTVNLQVYAAKDMACQYETPKVRMNWCDLLLLFLRPQYEFFRHIKVEMLDVSTIVPR